MTFFDKLWDGKHMAYDHSFAMQIAKVYINIIQIVVLVNLILFALNIILSLLVYFLLKPKKNKQVT